MREIRAIFSHVEIAQNEAGHRRQHTQCNIKRGLIGLSFFLIPYYLLLSLAVGRPIATINKPTLYVIHPCTLDILYGTLAQRWRCKGISTVSASGKNPTITVRSQLRDQKVEKTNKIGSLSHFYYFSLLHTKVYIRRVI